MSIELKGHLKMEINKEKNHYEFCMPIGAPLGECYDACFDMLQKIIALANDAVDKSKRKEGDNQEVEIVGDAKKKDDKSKK